MFKVVLYRKRNTPHEIKKVLTFYALSFDLYLQKSKFIVYEN